MQAKSEIRPDASDASGHAVRIGVEPFDVSFGAGYRVEDESASDIESVIVEDGGEFQVHRPPSAGWPGRLCFVDGVMRTEALLTRTGSDGTTSSGLAGSWAAGAVLTAGAGPARIEHVKLGRAVIFTGGHRAALPAHRNGWEWASHSIEGEDANAAREKLRNLMRGVEAEIAHELRAEGGLTVFDGPLHRIWRSWDTPVVGYVKTHHRRTLAAEHWARVPLLSVGERSSVFAMADDLYASYLRVGDAGPWAGPWAGIVRIEIPAGAGREAGIDAANHAAGLLPKFASALHRDARAPVNLTPVSGLERHLHRLLGDSRLAIRAVREAVLEANA